jgi:hypothetical protein
MMNETKAAELEAAIRELTGPINGQYPRPWITRSKDPASSKVFVVGMNDAKTFPVSKIGSHDRFLDALFNRGGEACYKLFYKVISELYPTRNNIDNLIRRLEKYGVTDVLSTNMICYSTTMSCDLRDSSHENGADTGRKIFMTVFEIIEPKIMIVHGSRAVNELSRVLKHHFPQPPPPIKLPPTPVEAVFAQTSVFVIPSLALPFYSQWSRWSNEHLDDLCRVVAARLEVSTLGRQARGRNGRRTLANIVKG